MRGSFKYSMKILRYVSLQYDFNKNPLGKSLKSYRMIHPSLKRVSNIIFEI